ncbi:MAG: hypothetical protein O8C66_07225 [Candidatus Methanoperedens sp.]|nr:hypothetical protein [Candidatus Methanoperedens sp.]
MASSSIVNSPSPITDTSIDPQASSTSFSTIVGWGPPTTTIISGLTSLTAFAVSKVDFVWNVFIVIPTI